MLTFFTPFDVKMIQISTFPAAPSTERVPSLAERVASLRYSINLQLLNNRVPGLLCMYLLALVAKLVISAKFATGGITLAFLVNNLMMLAHTLGDHNCNQ